MQKVRRNEEAYIIYSLPTNAYNIPHILGINYIYLMEIYL